MVNDIHCVLDIENKSSSALYAPWEYARNVFGLESKGDTLYELAKTSQKLFVRSQFLLAMNSAMASGHKLTALEALIAYGFEAIESARDGSYTFNHCSSTWLCLKTAREQLQMAKEEVSVAAGVSLLDVHRCEKIGNKEKIRPVLMIAIALGMDFYKIGTQDSEEIKTHFKHYDDKSKEFSANVVFSTIKEDWVKRHIVYFKENFLFIPGKPFINLIERYKFKFYCFIHARNRGQHYKDLLNLVDYLEFNRMISYDTQTVIRKFVSE